MHRTQAQSDTSSTQPQEDQNTAHEKHLRELKEELFSLKEQETTSSFENKSMTSELSELKLQLERLVYESKEAAITTDAMREQNTDLAAELEELRVRSLPLISASDPHPSFPPRRSP